MIVQLALLVQVILRILMFLELAILVVEDNSLTLERIHVVTAIQATFVLKMLSQTSHRTLMKEVILVLWDSTVQQERIQQSHVLLEQRELRKLLVS